MQPWSARRRAVLSRPSFWGEGAVGATSERGKSSVAVVPTPTLLSILTDPPDCCANPYTCGSPKPDPLPISLVVKKGSKTRARTSGGDAGAGIFDRQQIGRAHV